MSASDRDEAETLELLRCSQLDDVGWGRLLESFRPRLRTMIELRMHSLIRGRVDASDIIQEAMIDASQRLPEFLENPSVPFYIWLRSLTGQRLAAAHRRNLGTKARDSAREISIFEQPFPAATSAIIAANLIGQLTSPSNAAILEEQKLRLQHALDELEPIDREILVLRHFEELSNAEAAAELGLRPTASNNRYIRALCRLKSVLRNYQDSPSEFT
ncbi:MAG: sigma-70 family RNA polymerase sigma factor [Pirellulaceae bacterium]